MKKNTLFLLTSLACTLPINFLSSASPVSQDEETESNINDVKPAPYQKLFFTKEEINKLKRLHHEYLTAKKNAEYSAADRALYHNMYRLSRNPAKNYIEKDADALKFSQYEERLADMQAALNNYINQELIYLHAACMRKKNPPTTPTKTVNSDTSTAMYPTARAISAMQQIAQGLFPYALNYNPDTTIIHEPQSPSIHDLNQFSSARALLPKDDNPMHINKDVTSNMLAQ